MDEAGFFEVIEGRRCGDGFRRFKVECEDRESGEAADDGGRTVSGCVEGVVDKGGVEPDGGCALLNAVCLGACFCGERGEFWLKIGEQGELFARVAEGLEQVDEGEVFGIHGSAGWFTDCVRGVDAIGWKMLSGKRRISRCPVR